MSKQSLGRVSLVPKGAYNALSAYKRLDVVTHGGASYIVLRPVQGVTPVDGEDYMLLVQDGDTPNLSVGTVETLEAGSKATASIGGTPGKPVLNFGIPKGDTGAAPVLKMGTVTTLEPGSDATASLTGTPENPVLNLSIPRGASGGVDVANAEVGQTIIVKAVDANGKPTEWEAADMASGGGDVRLIHTATLTENTQVLSISSDIDGNTLEKYQELYFEMEIIPAAENPTPRFNFQLNGGSICENIHVFTDKTTYVYAYFFRVADKRWIGWSQSKELRYKTPSQLGTYAGQLAFHNWMGYHTGTEPQPNVLETIAINGYFADGGFGLGSTFAIYGK